MTAPPAIGYTPPRRLPLPPDDDVPLDVDECHICGGVPHDRDLHNAVLSIRRYLHDRLELVVRPVKKGSRSPTSTLILPTHRKRRRVDPVRSSWADFSLRRRS
jgi:hypothetical protein